MHDVLRVLCVTFETFLGYTLFFALRGSAQLNLSVLHHVRPFSVCVSAFCFAPLAFRSQLVSCYCKGKWKSSCVVNRTDSAATAVFRFVVLSYVRACP